MMSASHRCAVVRLLEKESSVGVRQSRARDLLNMLSDVELFSIFDVSPADVAPTNATIGPAGLPTIGELSDPSIDRREVFQRLRNWLRNTRKVRSLADVG